MLVTVDFGAGDPVLTRLNQLVSGPEPLELLITVENIETGETWSTTLESGPTPLEPREIYRYVREPLPARTVPLGIRGSPMARRGPVAANKFRITIDPGTGETPWSFTIRRVPDGPIATIIVTVEDETASVVYGPETLSPTVPAPEPVPDPDPDPPPAPNHTIVLIQGGGQSAEQGSELPTEIVVEVRDTATGDPIEAEAVDWSVLDGGSVVGDSPTDAGGRAGAVWTLADTAGTKRLRVTTALGSLVISATATAPPLPPPPPPPPPPPSGVTVAIQQGDGQTGQIGTQLSTRIIVKVTDNATGNPAAGHPIAWTPSGDGQLSGAKSSTGEAGFCDTFWVLGTTAGTQLLRAEEPGGSYVEFSATATAPAPAPPPTPPPTGQNVTPANLYPILGPMLSAPATVSPWDGFDSRFLAQEQKHFNDYLALESNQQVAPWIIHNHYSALMGRLMYAIRAGLPFGAGATNESTQMYARGKRILRRYLLWSSQNQYGLPAHNNTGLYGIECLLILEGDSHARNHLHVTAQQNTIDPYGYLAGTHATLGAAGRIGAVALQSLGACHRLGIPYQNNPLGRPGNFDSQWGSWKGRGTWVLDQIEANYLQPDGSIPQKDRGGREGYLFNAMLATALFKYHATVDPTGPGKALALEIMAHLLSEWQAYAVGGRECLPYETGGAEAPDLAGYYPWPCAVAWQETGDTAYRTMATTNIVAARRAFLTGVKQWNQTYGETMAQGAQAVLAGEPWSV